MARSSFESMFQASVSADRISEILTTENKVADPEKGTEKHLGQKVKGVVEFKNVSFRYDGADADVLENISFTAKPGETTAFEGEEAPELTGNPFPFKESILKIMVPSGKSEH